MREVDAKTAAVLFAHFHSRVRTGAVRKKARRQSPPCWGATYWHRARQSHSGSSSPRYCQLTWSGLGKISKMPNGSTPATTPFECQYPYFGGEGAERNGIPQRSFAAVTPPDRRMTKGVCILALLVGRQLQTRGGVPLLAKWVPQEGADERTRDEETTK